MHLSDHDRRLVFGIGEATEVEVTVQWPCGSTEQLRAGPGELITVEEKHCLISGKTRG